MSRASCEGVCPALACCRSRAPCAMHGRAGACCTPLRAAAQSRAHLLHCCMLLVPRRCSGSCYFGASTAALHKLASYYGYFPVAVDLAGVNGELAM